MAEVQSADPWDSCREVLSYYRVPFLGMYSVSRVFVTP
jgi:hypothetical protein